MLTFTCSALCRDDCAYVSGDAGGEFLVFAFPR